MKDSNKREKFAVFDRHSDNQEQKTILPLNITN